MVYVLKVTLRGSACGSDLWQHCPVPSSHLDFPVFCLIWHATLVQRAITARALCRTVVLGGLSPHDLVQLENVSCALNFVLQVHNKPLGAVVLPYSKRACA
jgi:hypothetical protein